MKTASHPRQFTGDFLGVRVYFAFQDPLPVPYKKHLRNAATSGVEHGSKCTANYTTEGGRILAKDTGTNLM